MSTMAGFLALLALTAAAGLAQGPGDANPQGYGVNAPGTIRVSYTVMAGLVNHRALPEYPEGALTNDVHGEVILKIVVDENGKAVLSEPVKGDPLLVSASVDAVRGFRFHPYRLNGRPAKVESQLGFHFGLNRKGEVAKGHVEYMSAIPYQQEFRTPVSIANGAFVLWPHKISGSEPQLPPELVGESGSAYLTVIVGADGKVVDVKVIGGDERFINFVVDAVKQFVYQPYLVEGRPSVTTIPVSYHYGRQR
jgi:outer membrane biosynthesis protein TonB